jgi:hypothetical protein
MKKTIPFKMSSKRIRYFGINLIKEVQKLFTTNDKILLKKK